MHNKRVKLSTLLVIVGLLVVASFSTVFAAPAAPASGPADAVAPSADWMPISGKSSYWYVFRDEGDGSPISVRMKAVGDVSFAVYTPDNLRTPVGRGTPNASMKNDLFWTGGFLSSGNYYVVVHNNSAKEGDYLLDISGSKVSFPAASQAVTPSPQTTAEEISPVTTSPAASISDQIMSIDGQQRELKKGDLHTYAFQYDGHGGQIALQMVDHPFGTASFEVWTPAEWNAHTQPIGVGSPDSYVGQDSLVWSGHFNAPGTYYVVVRHSGQADMADYLLTVSGAGVSH